MIFVLIRKPVSFESINGNCEHYCPRPHWELTALPRQLCYHFQQKFDKLILMKITTRCHILKLKCTQFNFGWGSAPDPTGKLTALP